MWLRGAFGAAPERCPSEAQGARAQQQRAPICPALDIARHCASCHAATVIAEATLLHNRFSKHGFRRYRSNASERLKVGWLWTAADRLARSCDACAYCERCGALSESSSSRRWWAASGRHASHTCLANVPGASPTRPLHGAHRSATCAAATLPEESTSATPRTLSSLCLTGTARDAAQAIASGCIAPSRIPSQLPHQVLDVRQHDVPHELARVAELDAPTPKRCGPLAMSKLLTTWVMMRVNNNIADRGGAEGGRMAVPTGLGAGAPCPQRL